MTLTEIFALGALIVSGIALLRSFAKDSKSNNVELTTVIVKLESIGSDITEIKKDIRSVKADVREHSDRITKAEQKIEALDRIVKLYHRCDNPEE